MPQTVIVQKTDERDKAMLNYENTSIVVKCQGFEAKGVELYNTITQLK